MREDHFSALPDELQRVARVDPNGEVSWPCSQAAAAINDLANSGAVVLGLDIRDYDPDGGLYEIPWSSFEPEALDNDSAKVEAARRAALSALERVDSLPPVDGTVERRVLVTWQ